MTLSDIAKKAKVSISTVSRIISNDPTLNVKASTRNTVLRIVRQSGYKTPKQKGKYHNLSVTLISWYKKNQEIEDIYYLSIRLGIEARCNLLGIKLNKVFYDIPFESSLIPADGAIAVGKFDDEEIRVFESIYKNIVFVDSSPDSEKFDSVVVDFACASKKAIDYLVNLGHEQIGYIGSDEYTGKKEVKVVDERLEYYKTRFSDSSKVYLGKFSIDSGYQIMKKIIENNELVKCYLVSSDQMAIGVLKALNEFNIDVPKEVSVMGFNDIIQSEYTNPPLSTIKVYNANMGLEAVNLLVEQLEGRSVKKKVVIQTSLVVRDSTGFIF